MLKKTLATLLALALLVGCLPAMASGDGRSYCFVPDELVAAFNDMIDYTLENIGDSITEAEKDELAGFMRLAFSEVDGEDAFYDNADGSIILSARLLDSTEAPAECLWLTLAKASLDETRMRLAQVALATAICTLDPAVEFDALYAWITESGEAGARIDIDGCQMELTCAEDSWIYEIRPGASGIALDDGDALKSLLSDYLDSGKSNDAEPTPTPSPMPTPNPDLLVDWDGFSAELLRISPTVYDSGKVDLTFYCRFINATDLNIDMRIADAVIDGVPVRGIGKTGIVAGSDSGTDSSQYFFIVPDDDNFDAGVSVICNPGTLTATVELKNEGELLYSQPISIDLIDVPSFTPKPTVLATPTPVPVEYVTLCKGDRGDDVANMQWMLIDLGYLSGDADGVFGTQTAEAVRLFNEANGFGSSELATPEMQDRLFSNDSVPYEEPWVPLIFTSSSHTYWKKYSGNKLGVNVEVKNSSRTHTIKAFELYMYAENVYGERIYGETTYYYGTTTKKVKPGKTVKSDYIVVPNRSEVYTVYIAINKVVFDDGTVRECDEPNYWYWTTPWA